MSGARSILTTHLAFAEWRVIALGNCLLYYHLFLLKGEAVLALLRATSKNQFLSPVSQFLRQNVQYSFFVIVGYIFSSLSRRMKSSMDCFSRIASAKMYVNLDLDCS